MGIESKLRQWREAGLIDTATEARILEYESGRGRPLLLYAVGGLGALAIAIGLVAVIAANWDALGRGAKLGADLLLGFALAVAVYRLRAADPSRAWLRESAVIVFYAWTLASMALVGQVYQLTAPTWQTLLVWSVSTLPLVLLGQGRFLGVLAWLGWAFTYGFGAVGFIEALAARASDSTVVELATANAMLGPLLFLLATHATPLARWRPQLAGSFALCTWLAIAAGGVAAQLLWYASTRSEDVPRLAPLACLGAAALVAWRIPLLHPSLTQRGVVALRALLMTAYALVVIGVVAERDPMPFVGAVTNLGFLCLLAWCVLQLGSPRGFQLATALIGLRLVGIYIEVFGSMLQTGLGLILGGILTLLLTWVWLKRAPQWAGALARGEDADAS